MAINIARVEYQNTIHWGRQSADKITLLPIFSGTTGELITNHSPDELKTLVGAEIDLEHVKILSPVTANQQFVCQGANYRQHMIESGVDPDAKSFNMIFTKAQSCICSADSPVIRPKQVKLLDYEVELGLVLKRTIQSPTTVTPDTILDYLAGLVIVNDYSARDVQIPQMQFYKGKSFRTFGPVGPWLCLLEPQDLKHLLNLNLELRVDNQIRQQDNTKNLVFQPAETLSELSGVQDFAAGDLLATGTPSGCALAAPSPRIQRLMGLLPEKIKWRMFVNAQSKRKQYLQPGQTVTTSIRSDCGSIDLGTQSNAVVSE
jgi:2-keto-4-pentenoate hydratase/2-oxohepta-3-ene-1,7-dioic acid hydratase in catechol pathway